MRAAPVLLFPFLIVTVFAQGPDTFEVSTIKRSDSITQGSSQYHNPGGSLRVENYTLEALIRYAYDLQDFELTGASGWMTTERYSILTKGIITDGPADYRQMNDRQSAAVSALIRKRTQALLADRFHLQTHWATRELPVYTLIVANGGSKLTTNTQPDGSAQLAELNHGHLHIVRQPLDAIAGHLAYYMKRPVRNRTGIAGSFDMDLHWARDENDASGPSLFTALQEQLGLKLQAGKGSVAVLVVDRAERPTEN